MRSIRKIVQIGNCLGVSFPKEILKKWGVGIGDWVEICQFCDKKKTVHIRVLEQKNGKQVIII